MFGHDHCAAAATSECVEGSDPFALIAAGVALLAQEDRSSWSGPARAEVVLGVAAAHERLEAELVRAIGEWNADQSWLADGALSAPSWLAARAPMGKQRANELVRMARLTRRHDRVAKALAAGDVSSAHVDVLARAARGRASLFERDEDVLVDVAESLSVDDFTVAARHWRSAADDEMAREDAHLAFEERSLTFATTLFGRVDVRGSLDAEGGALVQQVLRGLVPPDPAPEDGGPADGPRTLGQRCADALVQLCSQAVHGWSSVHCSPAMHGSSFVHGSPATHGSPGARRSENTRGSEDERSDDEAARPVPGLDCVIDVARLARSDGPSGVRGWMPDARCEIRGLGPVARSVLERLACDAAVGRIVMRGRSEVLDVGRRTRVVPRALRRAIEARDGRCAFPGCRAPVHWCDVHHVVHWADGGETNLENCVLLCRRHHVLCHEGGWRLTRDPSGDVDVVRCADAPRAPRPSRAPRPRRAKAAARARASAR